MAIRPDKQVRVDPAALEALTKAFVQLRDEYAKIELLRDATVRIAAGANRLRADLAKSEARVRDALETAFAVLNSILEVAGGKAPAPTIMDAVRRSAGG